MTLTTPRPPRWRALLDRAPIPVLGLVGWTLFVWATRIRNIVADETLTGWAATWRLGLATTFVVAAGVVVVGLVVRPAVVPSAARALAGLSIAVWVARGGAIALGDHDPGFIAVHLVLAGVTIALGIAVLRRFGPWPTPAGGGDGSRGAPGILR